MKKIAAFALTGAVLAAVVLWWRAPVEEKREAVPETAPPAMREAPGRAVPPESAFRAAESRSATLFGHPPGLTLEEQNELREPELIQNVPAEVIEHARTEGFPFEGVVVHVVPEHGFWLVAHHPVDAYMWAAENRPIHPEDPARLGDFGPGDVLRGRVFHGEDRYILRLP